jgi:cytosine/adenosine deaminase-related metal-dependent hydrolase
MFTAAAGPMYQWLKPQRDMSDCGLGSPVQWLARCGYLGPELLAVHCNYLVPEDIALLAAHGVSVVHCPRSHAYFGHRPFPWQALVQAGAKLCLGTDSLASVSGTAGQPVELDLFAEMQALAAAAPALEPRRILEMATVNAAHALGRPGQLGELVEGAWADLIALPFTGSIHQATEAVVHHRGPVVASQIAGRWVWGAQAAGA